MVSNLQREKYELLVKPVAQPLGALRPGIAAGGTGETGKQAGIPVLAPGRVVLGVQAVGQRETVAGATDEIACAAFDAIGGKVLP